MFVKLVQWAKKRKFLSVSLSLLLIGGGFWVYRSLHKQTTPVAYVLSSVQKGTLMNSVSGSGQIAVSSQVDVKAKGSGEVLNVLVKNGQEVKSGTVLVQLDARDAIKTVRDAQTSLETAQLSLEKLRNSITPSTLAQSENSLTSAKTSLEKLKLSQQISYQQALESKQKAEDTLTKGYEDAFNTVSDAFLDLPTITTELKDILLSSSIGKSESSISDDETNSSALFNNIDVSFQPKLKMLQLSAENDYRTARTKYDKNFEHYKTISRYSSKEDIVTLLDETVETTKSLAQAAKSELNFLDSWADFRSERNQNVYSVVKTYQTNLGSDIGKINSHLSSVLSVQRTIKDNQATLLNAERTITQMNQNNPLDLAAAEATVRERQNSLDELKKGVDPLDIRSAQITIDQRRIALVDAQQKLGDYTVRAPFDGVIAKIDLRKGDTVSNGGTIATFITQQKLASISLNEVDVAKIKVGQKVTLTFDAIEDLTISGQVGEIDTLGTTSQGVVSYTVKILFDTQDERVKSGMTVSATIITDVKTDVLMVDNSAIKTQGNSSYVEVLTGPTQPSASGVGVTSANPPDQRMVEIGLSNDTSTEIVSGLKEGDQIITRTITPSANTASAQAPSLLGGSATRGLTGGGGNFRMQGR